MSILDDENILIENVRESCGLIKPLEEILEEFSITNTINTANSEKCEKFFNKLSRLKIDNCEWYRYFDRFILYNKEIGYAVFVILFEKVLQDYTGDYTGDYFNREYKINLKITAYNHLLSEEHLSNFISLFDLNNDQMWEAKRNFNYHPDYPYTTYKYVNYSAAEDNRASCFESSL